MSFLHSIQDFFDKASFKNSRAQFYDDLADAIVANRSTDRFLEMAHAYAKKFKLPGERIYPQLRHRVKSMPLPDVLAPFVPPSDRMVVAAAVRSGRIEEGLKFLVRSLGYVKEMQGAIKMAVATPVFLFLFLMGILAGIALFGVPAMTELIPADKWQGGGRSLLAISTFVKNFGLVTLGVIAAVVWGYVKSLTEWTGPNRATLDRKLLFYKVNASYQGAMMLVSLSALVQGGTSIVAGLRKISEASSPWLRWHIARVVANLERSPDKFAEALDTGLFAPRILFRVALAADSGNVESKLETIAMQAMEETLRGVKAASGVVNKILLVIFAISLLYVFGNFMLTAQSIGMAAGRG